MRPASWTQPHPGRTGREILTLAARTMGLRASRVEEMLGIVSLDTTEARRRVRNYSLGMRQRLGIVQALLIVAAAAIVTIVVAVQDEPIALMDCIGIAGTAMAVLLPVMGVLAITRPARASHAGN